MVKKRMAMRMVTIFVALIICGMFFPDLARGEDLNVDQGLNVPFGDVVVGEQKTISLGITNQRESALTLYPTFKMDFNCDFTHTELRTTVLEPVALKPDAIFKVDVTFSPSAEGSCNAWLQISYMGSEFTTVEVSFTANGKEEEEPSEAFIEIRGFNTGVTDREAKLDENNSTLAEMIGECEATAYNCGQLRRCVKRLTRQLMREETIDYQEMRALHKAAIRAEMHKMVEEMKASRRLKTYKSSGRSKWWCWWRR